ncbi:hypothetical protein [Paracraurococcus ruber]|uniref:Uncharacterized protein n=1 Tax=Paracraurococcus ruber TaxID=77675 RepID=A0ABS1D4F1_9PROT|nr:hypothetical protein [Paracraurococcus ruber]MBK1661330.1 hypothetical protein [Paracraurococcus ruber]TDG23086.1 hypothetical protein E2C05_26535 [Paracraurococcus ruber]
MPPTTTLAVPTDAVPAAAWLPRLPIAPGDALLLDEAAAGPDDRVLILGAPSAELLCAALRHGCRAAQEARTPPKHPDPADLVVAVVGAAAPDAAAIATCARRALADSRAGRLAVLLPAAGALARSVIARLRSLGFGRIRRRPRADGALLLVCRLQPVLATAGRR